MRRSVFLAAAYLSLCPPSASAQYNADPPAGRHLVTFEMLRPSLKQGPDLSAASGMYFVGGSFALSPELRLVVDVPFAILSETSQDVSISRSGIGNPHIGLETTRQNRLLGFGVRLPVASTSGFTLSTFSDFMRMEALIPDLLSMRVYGALRSAAAPIGAELRLGSAVLMSTDGPGGTDAMLDYSGRVRLEQSAFRAMLGVDGRFTATGSGSFSDRSMHQLGAAASHAFGRVRPGIHVRLPLSEAHRNVVDATFGVSLEVLLGPDDR